MSDLRFELSESGSVEIGHNSKNWGSLKCSIIRPSNSSLYGAVECAFTSANDRGGKAVTISGEQREEGIKVEIELENKGCVWAGKFRAWGKGVAIIRLVLDLPVSKQGFCFVPAFMYGRNEGGKDRQAFYPQLGDVAEGDSAKPWMSEEWLVRADRSSHCLSSVIMDDFAVGLGGRDVCRYEDGTVAEKNGLGISSTNPQRMSFSLGFINHPYTYSAVGGRNFIRAPEGYVDLDKGPAESELFLLAMEHGGRREAASEILRQSYGVVHDSVSDPGRGVDEAIDDIAGALVEYGYCAKARNFYTGFSEKAATDAECRCFSSGWAGRSEVAYPLLAAGYKRGREEWLECARTVLSNLAENAISAKSGMFFDNYDLVEDKWSVRGWWSRGEGHSGYVNGQVCHYLLKGYLLEKTNGTEQSGWLDSAKRVLDQVAKSQGDDGRFGYYYSEEDGTIKDGVGFAGCWFVPALANLYRITKEDTYLEAARRAMDFYRGDVEAFEVFGCPHDIWKSPDEEGILAWIAGAKLLHEITGEKQFLDDLLAGLDYEFSWKFAYNVINEVEPLKSLNWCSTGGSVTSVNNSHIHPMGSATLENILYAWQQTKDEYTRSRLTDTLRWTLNAYLHDDGQYGWGKKGMINERYCYTDSLLLERFADGSASSTWFCGHSWASGSVLEGLAGKDIEDSLLG